MIDGGFTDTLLLLGAAVAIIIVFQRLNVPSSLGYLLVGLLFGPHTAGPVIDPEPLRALAEFGIVFLLFTIGLNFALPQIHGLRHLVLGLGTAQVALTTAVVATLAWLCGLPPAAAFVVGAVFAQSSTTIISRQLTEQAEEQSRHGRLGVAMSVFQDVTAVPFVIVIPVLGTAAAGAFALAESLAWATVKAAIAFALVFLLGRQVLRPLFHIVAQRRSAELFTLTALLVSLGAAWTTNIFGLSMAFGAFLAGMVLGETEFRHQVESVIRPFRDVLLGLFFIGIGTLFDPAALPAVWHWAVLGALALLLIKALLVALIVRSAGIDALTAWRTGWLLAVGGEFGFALLAIALEARAIAAPVGQSVLTAVLFSMIAAPFLIRHNLALARWCAPRVPRAPETAPQPTPDMVGHLRDHVVVCGYGRIGQSVAYVLTDEGIPYVALDLEPIRVRDAHTAGEPVFYGDAGERDMLQAVGLETARLLVISHDDVHAALRTLQHARELRPDLAVMVRTRDETHVEALRAAGASEVVPETVEASLMIAVQALLLLSVPVTRVLRRLYGHRGERYQMLHEFFRGDALDDTEPDDAAVRLRPVVLPGGSAAVGRPLDALTLAGVTITALVRRGQRTFHPPGGTRLEAGDVVVLLGAPEALQQAEQALLA